MTVGLLEFSLGCEFHFSCDNIADALENPSRYTINQGPYVLIEFSDYAMPPNVADQMLSLLRHGMTPVITHPERSPILARHSEVVKQFTSITPLCRSQNAYSARIRKQSSRDVLRISALLGMAEGHETEERHLSIAAKTALRSRVLLLPKGTFCNNPQTRYLSWAVPKRDSHLL